MEKVGEQLEGGRCGMGLKMFENCKKFPHLNLYVSVENKWVFFWGGGGVEGISPKPFPLDLLLGNIK